MFSVYRRIEIYYIKFDPIFIILFAKQQVSEVKVRPEIRFTLTISLFDIFTETSIFLSKKRIVQIYIINISKMGIASVKRSAWKTFTKLFDYFAKQVIKIGSNLI